MYYTKKCTTSHARSARVLTGSSGDGDLFAHLFPAGRMSPRALLLAWRCLVVVAFSLPCLLLSGCADMGGPLDGEPTNGCLLAAINERAVLRAKNYMKPNVEAHLLAIWFQEQRHVALIVKGDTRWFAWDDAYGGRPLFLGNPWQLPDAMSAAQAAFPLKTVDMAWWVD